MLFALPAVAAIEDGEDTGLGLFGDMDPATDGVEEEYFSFCWCLLPKCRHNIKTHIHKHYTYVPPPPLGGEEEGEVGAGCASSILSPDTVAAWG